MPMKHIFMDKRRRRFAIVEGVFGGKKMSYVLRVMG